MKEPKTSKEKTQIQTNVSKVGTREGIELGWLWGFGLNEFGV
jgi:hypothetical protein